MTDPTEAARRALIPEMPADLQAAIERGEPFYTTDEMREQFTVEGFMAPVVVVTRKADGQKGTLVFTSNPRYYFGFVAD